MHDEPQRRELARDSQPSGAVHQGLLELTAGCSDDRLRPQRARQTPDVADLFSGGDASLRVGLPRRVVPDFVSGEGHHESVLRGQLAVALLFAQGQRLFIRRDTLLEAAFEEQVVTQTVQAFGETGHVLRRLQERARLFMGPNGFGNLNAAEVREADVVENPSGECGIAYLSAERQRALLMLERLSGLILLPQGMAQTVECRGFRAQIAVLRGQGPRRREILARLFVLAQQYPDLTSPQQYVETGGGRGVQIEDPAVVFEGRAVGVHVRRAIGRQEEVADGLRAGALIRWQAQVLSQRYHLEPVVRDVECPLRLAVPRRLVGPLRHAGVHGPALRFRDQAVGNVANEDVAEGELLFSHHHGARFADDQFLALQRGECFVDVVVRDHVATPPTQKSL